MKPVHRSALLCLVMLLLATVMIWQHPLHQWPNYHAFADQRSWLGLPRAADVLSNLGFALVGAMGLWLLWTRDEVDLAHSDLDIAWHGLSLFFVGLLLTAAGSTWYHLQPDNARLIWDRLPIALACAGLADAVASHVLSARGARVLRVGLLLAAPASVLWWAMTRDLAPYAFVQLLPVVLVPVALLLAPALRADTGPWLLALVGYIAAKIFERADQQIFEGLRGLVSGHTLKHLAAAGAGLCVVWIVRRHLLRAGAAAAPGIAPNAPVAADEPGEPASEASDG